MSIIIISLDISFSYLQLSSQNYIYTNFLGRCPFANSIFLPLQCWQVYRAVAVNIEAEVRGCTGASDTLRE